jgi:hypothetical protein
MKWIRTFHVLGQSKTTFSPCPCLRIVRVCRQSAKCPIPFASRLFPIQTFRVQPKPKPESLDDLLINAEHYANFSMRNMGRLPPTLFLIGANGPLMFMPDNLADEHAKDDFATTARLMCIAHAATAVVMALEVWMTCAKPDEKFDMTEPPSEAFDRQEVVMLNGEARDAQRQKFLPIIRSGNGKFFGFGESDVAVVDEMKGRFAQILPPKMVDDQMRMVAEAMLTIKGITPAKIRSGSKRPRFRM